MNVLEQASLNSASVAAADPNMECRSTVRFGISNSKVWRMRRVVRKLAATGKVNLKHETERGIKGVIYHAEISGPAYLMNYYLSKVAKLSYK